MKISRDFPIHLVMIVINNLRKKKILITGGAGFIGSHLCEHLANDPNNDVYSLDNYFTGSYENHVLNVHYLTGNTADIAKVVTFKPDIIYHLGEYSRVEQSFGDIEKVLKYNTTGTYAILEFARKTRCKILYAGSSTKFGDEGMGRNASPYAWTKATNTELVINYGKWFKIPYAITYFYNVYGPREISTGKYATLIALFKQKMKEGKPLTVVSPGTQERNFTHINDIIEGLILVGEKGNGDEYGIGNPEKFTILEVAKLFNGKIEMLPERPGNRQTAEVLIKKTQSLGWTPKIKLADYINSLRETNWI